MDWTLYLSIVGTLATLIGVLASVINNHLSRLDEEIRGINQKLDEHIHFSCQRTDRLYEMFLSESKDFHGRLCAIEERNKERK